MKHLSHERGRRVVRVAGIPRVGEHDEFGCDQLEPAIPWLIYQSLRMAFVDLSVAA